MLGFFLLFLSRFPAFLSYLVGVRLEPAELDALLELDPPDGAKVLYVHLPLLDVLEQHLDSGLAVVLAVGHQRDAGAFKVLRK